MLLVDVLLISLLFGTRAVLVKQVILFLVLLPNCFLIQQQVLPFINSKLKFKTPLLSINCVF